MPDFGLGTAQKRARAPAAETGNTAVVVPGTGAPVQSAPDLKRNGENADATAPDDEREAPAAADAHAARWLAQIARMLDRRRDEDAVASWDRFRAAYPQYPAPEELRARIETARARPVGAAPR